MQQKIGSLFYSVSLDGDGDRIALEGALLQKNYSRKSRGCGGRNLQVDLVKAEKAWQEPGE